MSFIFFDEEDLITLFDLKRQIYETLNQHKCNSCDASTFIELPNESIFLSRKLFPIMIKLDQPEIIDQKQ